MSQHCKALQPLQRRQPLLLRCSRPCRRVQRRRPWVVAQWKRNPAGGNSPEAAAEQVVTFFTADGLVQLPSRHAGGSELFLAQRLFAPLPSWEEQGLCIASTFRVAATNGHDPSRRINVLGFCRCTELLQEVVQHTVLISGGEVMRQELQMHSGLSQRLTMTVAVPFLFGVPPAFEALSDAIVSGGGVVDKITRQWQLY